MGFIFGLGFDTSSELALLAMVCWPNLVGWVALNTSTPLHRRLTEDIHQKSSEVGLAH